MLDLKMTGLGGGYPCSIIERFHIYETYQPTHFLPLATRIETLVRSFQRQHMHEPGLTRSRSQKSRIEGGMSRQHMPKP